MTTQPITSVAPHPTNLSVDFLPQEGYEAAHRTMKVWARIAAEKQELARGEDREFFESCEEISRNTAEYLYSMGPTVRAEVLVCEDAEGAPQGYMVLSFCPKSVFVEMLFTHPDNIKSPLNPNRVSLVGTTLMAFAEELAAEGECQDVTLSAFSDSISFYRKLGYESADRTKPHLMTKSVANIILQKTLPAA